MAAIDHFKRWRHKALPSIMARSILITLIFLLVILTFSNEGAQAQTVNDIEVGYYTNRPLSYRSGNGELHGLSVDLLRTIGKEEGWDIEFNEGEIEECREWLQNQEVDIVLGMEGGLSEDIDVSYSNETIVSNWGVIFTTGGFEIDSVIDLEGIWLGVVKEDIYYYGENGLEALLSSFKIETFIVEFDNYNELLEALENGQVDAGLLNHLLGQAVKEEWKISKTGIVFSPIDIRYAYPTNGSHTDSISKAIDQRSGN